MKILLATGIFEPEIGGPATLAKALASEFSKIGHAVSVVCYSDEERYDSDTSLAFSVARIKRGGKISNYARFLFFLLKNAGKYDLIYSLDWVSAGLPVWLASKILGKKYAVRVGGGYIWEKYLSEGRAPMTLGDFYDKGIYRQYKILYRAIKLVLRGASRVVFNSVEQRKLYEKYYFLDLTKTATIFNPIPAGDFKIDVLRPRDKEIIFAGRLVKMKNVDSALRAFGKFGNAEYRMTVIGDGPEKKNLEKLVRELGLEKRVSFLPPLSQEKLRERIKNCRYVILPSWLDVSPNQVFECLFWGVPFLLTKENYLPINSFDFVKIDPASVEDIAEKMKWLDNPENYEKFLDDLNKIKFENSLEDAAKKHLEIFNSILQNL